MAQAAFVGVGLSLRVHRRPADLRLRSRCHLPQESDPGLRGTIQMKALIHLVSHILLSRRIRPCTQCGLHSA